MSEQQVVRVISHELKEDGRIVLRLDNGREMVANKNGMVIDYPGWDAIKSQEETDFYNNLAAGYITALNSAVEVGLQSESSVKEFKKTGAVNSKDPLVIQLVQALSGRLEHGLRVPADKGYERILGVKDKDTSTIETREFSNREVTEAANLVDFMLGSLGGRQGFLFALRHAKDMDEALFLEALTRLNLVEDYEEWLARLGKHKYA